MKLLLELNARGATVIVASHDLYIIDKVRARVIELEEGKIVRDSGRAEVAPDSSVMQSERTIIEPETEKADDEPGTAYEVLGLEEDDAG
jgi:energy-coupling factor transporter ATP-binding protein EcfA2